MATNAEILAAFERAAADIIRLEARIEQLEAERDKWHRLAMQAGVVTCADGTFIVPDPRNHANCAGAAIELSPNSEGDA